MIQPLLQVLTFQKHATHFQVGKMPIGLKEVNGPRSLIAFSFQGVTSLTKKGSTLKLRANTVLILMLWVIRRSEAHFSRPVQTSTKALEFSSFSWSSMPPSIYRSGRLFFHRAKREQSWWYGWHQWSGHSWVNGYASLCSPLLSVSAWSTFLGFSE